MIANGSAILSSVLNIVARLEHDRQEAQTALELQQAKCQDLKDDLQREDERRHDLLLECIQEGVFVASCLTDQCIGPHSIRA